MKTMKIFTQISAVAAVFWLAAVGVNAANTPVFQYDFPASWNGMGAAVADQSTAGNDGNIYGALSLSSAVPTGAAAGTESINDAGGSDIISGATASLANATVAAAGGFTYDISFMWDGTVLANPTQRLIDYSGTEPLQLGTTTGSASLQMWFADNAGAETLAVSTTISPNTWYNVSLTFDTQGNSLDVNGDISGIASLYVNGSLADSGPATKGTYGDSLNRPIGVGGGGMAGPPFDSFTGDIYDASVSLGVVPEPSTFALCALGGLAMLSFRRRKS